MRAKVELFGKRRGDILYRAVVTEVDYVYNEERLSRILLMADTLERLGELISERLALLAEGD